MVTASKITEPKALDIFDVVKIKNDLARSGKLGEEFVLYWAGEQPIQHARIDLAGECVAVVQRETAENGAVLYHATIEGLDAEPTPIDMSDVTE